METLVINVRLDELLDYTLFMPIRPCRFGTSDIIPTRVMHTHNTVAYVPKG